MVKGERKSQQFKKLFDERIFQKLDITCSSMAKISTLLTKAVENAGQGSVKIPNVAITVNNKLIHAKNEFERAGISLYTTKLENSNDEVFSLLGESIIEHLSQELSQAAGELSNYCNEYLEIISHKVQEAVDRYSSNPIKRLFHRIIDFFVKPEYYELILGDLTEEERKELDSALKRYAEADDKIWKEELEDMIIPALVRKFSEKQVYENGQVAFKYPAAIVPDVLKEYIEPELTKLGLERLIPEVQEAITNVYLQEFPSGTLEFARSIIPEEEMYLYIPDFTSGQQGASALNDGQKNLISGLLQEMRMQRSINSNGLINRVKVPDFESNTQVKEYVPVHASGAKVADVTGSTQDGHVSAHAIENAEVSFTESAKNDYMPKHMGRSEHNVGEARQEGKYEEER